MHKYWFFSLFLLLFLSCKKDVANFSNPITPDSLPDFSLTALVNGTSLSFQEQTGHLLSKGTYYNEVDADKYQMGFYREKRTGPWYTKQQDNHESLLIYFTSRTSNANDENAYSHLEDERDFSYREPRLGSAIRYRAHLNYSAYGWYEVSNRNKMEIRWNFGQAWEPNVIWDAQTRDYTEPFIYNTPAKKNAQLEIFSAPGQLIGRNQLQFDFGEANKYFYSNLRPNNDTLFARVIGHPPFSYQWNTGATTPIIIPSGQGTKQYCVTITDGHGQINEACATYFFFCRWLTS